MRDETPARYSWYQVVTDRQFTCPRWGHHVVVKLSAQHTAPAFLALVVASLLHLIPPIPVAAPLTFLAGPVVYLGIVARKLWYRNRPNYRDWIHDGALACIPFAGGLILGGYRLAGLVTLTACLLTWRSLHRYAIP